MSAGGGSAGGGGTPGPLGPRPGRLSPAVRIVFWTITLGAAAAGAFLLLRGGRRPAEWARVVRVATDGAIELAFADGRARTVTPAGVELSAPAIAFVARALTPGARVRVRLLGGGEPGAASPAEIPAEIRLPNGQPLDLELIRRGLARPRPWTPPVRAP